MEGRGWVWVVLGWFLFAVYGGCGGRLREQCRLMGQGVEAEAGASAGVKKPHRAATSGKHRCGPQPAKPLGSLSLGGGAARARQPRGDFGEAKAPALTRVFLIKTSWVWWGFFAKPKPRIRFGKVAGFAVRLVPTQVMSSAPPRPEQNRWGMAPGVPLSLPCLVQGRGPQRHCPAQDLLLGRRCCRLGGVGVLALAASAQPAPSAPWGVFKRGFCRTGAVASGLQKPERKDQILPLFMGVTTT